MHICQYFYNSERGIILRITLVSSPNQHLRKDMQHSVGISQLIDDFINEFFSLWLHLQKNVQNHCPEHIFFRLIVIWQNKMEMEIHSEIKPPLVVRNKIHIPIVAAGIGIETESEMSSNSS